MKLTNFKWITSFLNDSIEAIINKKLRTFSPKFGYIGEVVSKQASTLTVTFQGDTSDTVGVLVADGVDFPSIIATDNLIILRLNGSIKGSSYIAIKNIG